MWMQYQAGSLRNLSRLHTKQHQETLRRHGPASIVLGSQQLPVERLLLLLLCAGQHVRACAASMSAAERILCADANARKFQPHT